jgi:hypothetical protein
MVADDQRGGAHETRIGSDAFTDHSGIIVRVGPVADRPIGRAAGKGNRGRGRSATGGVRADPTVGASFKTAIARRGPSAPATVLRRFIERVVAESARDASVRAVLDYGCGRGADVDYSRSLGIDAVGYDPHAPFGFASRRPTCSWSSHCVDRAASRMGALGGGKSSV